MYVSLKWLACCSRSAHGVTRLAKKSTGSIRCRCMKSTAKTKRCSYTND